MKKTFDYLEHTHFAATVCDKQGFVLYQNRCASERDGDVVGKNLFECHNAHSNKMIRHMMATGESNTYEVVRNGRRRLVHQTPWFDTDESAVSGLIELSIDLPDTYPTLNKDIQ